MNKDRVDRAAETRAGQVFRSLGWERRQVRVKATAPLFEKHTREWKYFPPPPTAPKVIEGGDHQ